MKLMRNENEVEDNAAPRLIPSHWPLESQDAWPVVLGIGLSDMGTDQGNDAAAFKNRAKGEWRKDLLSRLQAHMRRLYANMNNPNYKANAIELTRELQSKYKEECGAGSSYSASRYQPKKNKYIHNRERNLDSGSINKSQCCPQIVAFTGKSQFYSMFGPEDPTP